MTVLALLMNSFVRYLPSFPGVGNNAPIGIAFILHVAIAEFSIGAIILGVGMEWWSHVNGDARAARYAKAIVNSYYLLFSVGATLAVFAVVLLIGLYGNFMGTILNEFIGLIGVAFFLFLILTPTLVIYRNTFGTERHRTAHLALGIFVAILQVSFLVLIVGLDSYLMTPQSTGFGSLGNPSYLPDLIHRVVGSVSWTALVLAAYAVLRLRRATQAEERAFQSWAARVNVRIGAVFLFVMPIIGFVLLETTKVWSPGYFTNLVGGGNGSLMVVQMCIYSVVLIAVNVAFGWEGRPENHRVAPIATALVVILSAVSCLPSAVLGPNIYALRYIALGLAILVSALHLVYHSFSGLEVEGEEHRRPAQRGPVAFVASSGARQAVVIAGVAAAILALYMGYVKEEAKGSYVVYGLIHQNTAHALYQPPPGIYP